MTTFNEIFTQQSLMEKMCVVKSPTNQVMDLYMNHYVRPSVCIIVRPP